MIKCENINQTTNFLLRPCCQMIRHVYLTNPFISIDSAPKSGKPWKNNGALNCRSTSPPGPMEAIFFGPHVSGSAKCGGGSSSRLAHSRQIHREICALLLGALESLKMNLFEFCTVLPAQWATLTGSTQSVSSAETEQRLNKIIDSAKVSSQINLWSPLTNGKLMIGSRH